MLPGYLKVQLVQTYHLVFSKISSIARNPISYCAWLPIQVPSELIMCFVILAVCPASMKLLLAAFMVLAAVSQLEPLNSRLLG